MSLKHLGPGSEMPALKEGTLRIYSMVFCPYAQRPRLVAAAKQIQYETVNITLKKKPEWYLSKVNQLGQVPSLQHGDGRTLAESLIISEYLDNLYPENKLQPSDPFTNAQHKLIVERFSKVTTQFYRVFRKVDENAGKDLADALDTFEKDLNTDFFGGDKPAFVDYMIWPWFERIDFLKHAGFFEFDESKFPKLNAYFQRMMQLPAVQECYIAPEIFQKFFDSYLSEGEVDYDIGLKLDA